MTHVLVIGGGGREHAIAWKLAQSPRVDRLTIAPGNGGTAALAEQFDKQIHNADIDATDVVSLVDYAESQAVDLAVIGPEEPLAGGLVDQFEAAGLRVFGPHREAATVETSKSYAKDMMLRHGVPTPPYELFHDLDSALQFLKSMPPQELVIKADGLARGKGVFLPKGESDGEGILRALLERDQLGQAGRRVLIEQRLEGHELTVMGFTDGSSLSMMPAVRDHKRLHDHDIGPNTGGMGAFAPAPTLTPIMADRIRQEIMLPSLAALEAEQCCFKGVLNVGVVLTQDGPMALEMNVRFGDPAAQVVLPLLETDLMDVMDACVDQRLGSLDVRWRDQSALTVVLATAGYPERRDPGIPIIMGPLPEGVLVFHGGTRLADDGALVTSGGRVLAVTGVAFDLPNAITLAYDALRRVHFDGMHHRTDIGARALWR